MAVNRAVVIRLVADVHGMTAGMQQAEKSTSKLEARVAAMTKAVKAAAARSAEASARVATARESEAAATQRVTAAEERAATVRQAAAQAATRVGQAEARLAEVRSAGTAEMSSRVTAAEERVATARQQAEAAARRISVAEERLAELRAGGANVSAAELSAAERRVEQARAAAATAANRVAQAEARLTELRWASNASAAEVAAAEAGLIEAQAAHAQVSTAAAAAEGQLTTAQEAQAAAAAQVTAAQEAATAATNAQAAAAARSVARTRAWNAAAGKMAMVGATMGVGLAVAVKTFMDFDEAMGGVRANLDSADAGKLPQLTAAIKEAGAASVYSSVEAANAAEELIKAGVSATDVIGGGLTGALGLAAAGGVGLARAAEISAMAMTQFHLGGKDAVHIADVLAGGALASTASVDSLAMALGQGGGVASQFGAHLEDTVGTLSMFDQNALRGSDAGTSMKSMLLALANPSDKAAGAMEDLGLAAWDASGNFVGFAGLQDQLKDKTKNLTTQQREQAFATIFGSDAVRAANAMYGDQRGIRGWTEAVSKSGIASQVAAAKLNNAKGDLEALKGDLENVLIGAGEGANGPIRGLIQNVDALVSAFGKLPAGVQSGIFQVAAFGSAGLLATAGIIKLVNTIRVARVGIMSMVGSLRTSAAAMRAWAVAGSSSGTVMAGLRGRAASAGTAFMGMGTSAKVGAALAVAAIAAVGIAAATSGDDVENFGRRSSQLGLDLQRAAVGKGNLDSLFSNLQLAGAADKSMSLSQAMKTLADQTGSVGSKVDSFAVGLLKMTRMAHGGTEFEAIKGRLAGVGEELAKMAQEGDATGAATLFQRIAEEGKKASISTDELTKLMPAWSDWLNKSATSEEKASVATAKDAEAKKKAAEDTKKLVDAYKNLNSVLLQQAGGEIGYQSAIADATKAVKENGRATDITTEKGRNNKNALLSLAQAAGENASAVKASTNSNSQANAVLEDSRSKFITIAEQMGYTSEEAKKLAHDWIQIPGQATTDVSAPGASAVEYQINKLGQEVATLKGSSITIPADTPNAPQVLQMMTAIKDLRLSEDGKTMTISAKALGDKETKAAIESIPGIVHNKDGSVTVDVTELGAKQADAAIGHLSLVAKTADGQIVHIPASTNAAAIKQVIEQLHGAAVTFNGTQMVVKTSAPMAEADKKKLSDLAGTAIKFNGTSMTINSKAITADALQKIREVLAAAHDKVQTITTYHVDAGGSRVADVHRGPMTGLHGAAGGDVTSLPSGRFAAGGATTWINGKPYGFMNGLVGGQVRGPGSGTSDQVLTSSSAGLIRTANGEHILTAREVAQAGGHDAIYRLRAGIRSGRVRGFASGGGVDGDDWAPDMSAILSAANAMKVDGQTLTDQRNRVKDQTSALAKATRDLRAARAALSRAHGPARLKAENAVATAIEKQAKASRDLTASQQKLNSMSAGSKLDMTGRFIKATGETNKDTKTFLDNIDTISKKGFGPLALSLLNQGDSDAHAIAWTLAHGKLSQLQSAAKGLSASDALADRKKALTDRLTGATSAGLTATAQQQANAQLLALRASNAMIRTSWGPQQITATQVRQIVSEAVKSIPAPVVHTDVRSPDVYLGSEMVSRQVTGQQQSAANRGSSMIGVVPR